MIGVAVDSRLALRGDASDDRAWGKASGGEGLASR